MFMSIVRFFGIYLFVEDKGIGSVWFDEGDEMFFNI